MVRRKAKDEGWQGAGKSGAGILGRYLGGGCDGVV